MTDAEGVQLVVQALYIADFDGAEGFFDGRISALVKENPTAPGAPHIGKNRHIRQKALVDEIVVQLPLHTGIDGEVDNV